MAKGQDKETPYMDDGNVRLVARMTTGDLTAVYVYLGPSGEPVAVDIGGSRFSADEFAKIAAKVASLRVVDGRHT